MAKYLLAILGLLASLAAQSAEPPQLPFDLRAVADHLAGGDRVATVLDGLPAHVKAALLAFDEELTADERAVLLEPPWGSQPAVLAAAIGVLSQDDAQRRTRDGLLREARACFALRQRGTLADRLQTVAHTDEPNWLRDILPRVEARGRALAARFCREWADDPAVGELLWYCQTQIEGHSPASVRAEAMRRLGDRAPAYWWLQQATALLQDGDLPAAERALAALAKAPEPRFVEWRGRLEQDTFRLRSRLAVAKRWQDASRSPGLPGKVAQLRFLQTTDGAGQAVAASRAMVEQSVAHALPATILAAEAFAKGRREDFLAQLERAAAQPGGDSLLAALSWMGQVMPLVKQEGLSDEEAKSREALVEAAMHRSDAMLAEDDTEVAAMFHELRGLGWPFEREGMALIEAIGNPEFLKGPAPTTLSEYSLFLAATLAAHDVPAAREALARPVPTKLAGLPDLLRTRAEVGVYLALSAEADADANVESLLHDLERAQKDGRDANYLRGVLTWSRSLRAGASSESRQQARALFLAAQRQPFERGAWQAASALFVAQTALGEEVDPPALERTRIIAGASGGATVAAVATEWLGAGKGVPDFDAAVASVGDDSSALAVLHAALAELQVGAGHADLARVSARQALANAYGNNPLPLPIDGGVQVRRMIHWNWGASVAGATLDLAVSCDLYVLPGLPSRDRLKFLAGN